MNYIQICCNPIVNEDYTLVLPTLARAIGLSEAIIIQRIHQLLGPIAIEVNDRPWVCRTYEEFEADFPWWHAPNIKRIIKELEDLGVLLAEQREKHKFNHKKWYSIDYEHLAMIVQEQTGVVLNLQPTA